MLPRCLRASVVGLRSTAPPAAAPVSCSISAACSLPKSPACRSRSGYSHPASRSSATDAFLVPVRADLLAPARRCRSSADRAAERSAFFFCSSALVKPCHEQPARARSAVLLLALGLHHLDDDAGGLVMDLPRRLDLVDVSARPALGPASPVLRRPWPSRSSAPPLRVRGSTATVAVLVCTRPAASVAGTRFHAVNPRFERQGRPTRRRRGSSPLAFRKPPAASSAVNSSVSLCHPRLMAYFCSMSSRSRAHSAASAPPVPARTSRIY